jgi:molybdate transport system regulatory protein
MPRIIIRVALSPSTAIGPGKIRLLEHIDETGSISAAGRAMKMSYRRAWLLVDELNGTFKAFGRELVRRYRQIEADAHIVASGHLAALEAALRGRPTRRAKRRSAR